MISPKAPYNEAERLAELHSYNLLDTLPEVDYDNITALIASICDVPISLVTLLDKDRNFLKSHFGLDIQESPRDISFCGHAILNDNDLFIVEDARKDERFYDNPIIEEYGTVFYAGAPLRNENGYALGTLCIYDVKPRALSEKQKNSLKLLAKQVVNLFELHRKNARLLELQAEQKRRNERLHSFAHVVSHDLKSPLANITSLTRLLREENATTLSETSLQYLEYMEESSLTLKEYINGILRFYRNDSLSESQKEDVSYSEFFDAISEMLILKDSEFCYPTNGIFRNINKAALTQIVLNLVDNGLKYNPKELCTVTAVVSENDSYYTFQITDNGRGIEPEKQEEIFQLFKTAGIKDRRGKEGTGIGLATVKSLVTKLGGDIHLDSEMSVGSTFTFTIKK
ncbi:GAF domain-containing sensor histidine kinase [Altibacter sp.]|uniref:sensor histidine kinase n=1 Tax=Altibacter sp. TaxID=2024823 RepID=UPI0025886B2C|nr:GAF domain-containing sensor histidine kinase [Altibacter sp.]MCW9038048.1 GAF domain-containing sensor histidine kinase [Altibacter sp.]